MTTPYPSFGHLSDPDLLREVTRLAAREREATARVVASLAELDRRRLYLAEGYGSLFVYCTRVLGLSESATYKRITAARAAQRFPVILERLAAGDVTLTAIRLLAPHLTEANHVALLDEVRHCSTRQTEQVVARLQPRPDVPTTVRKLPTPPTETPEAQPPRASAIPDPPPAPSEPAASRDAAPPSCGPEVTDPPAPRRAPGHSLPPDQPRETVAPLAPARYKVSFTIGAETYAKLREAQALLRHVFPDSDVAALFDRGLTLLLIDAAKTKHAATEQPRHAPGREAPGHFKARQGTPASRHIPAEVKRRVWARDEGQCAFVSVNGHRCTERGFLEYHHCVPYAAGGEASVDNISLRCWAHNAHESEQAFGRWQPTSVREQSPNYGGDVASEAPPRVRVRDVFAVLNFNAARPRPRTNGRTSSLQLAARPVREGGAPTALRPRAGQMLCHLVHKPLIQRLM